MPIPVEYANRPLYHFSNYSGMLIGRSIAILYFLTRKITAEGAEERRVFNRLFPLRVPPRTLRLNSRFGYISPHVIGSPCIVKSPDGGFGYLSGYTKRKATKGATPTAYGHNWVEEGILFLRSECIEENKLSLNGAMFISEEAHKSMERSKVYPGDILIRITGDVGLACVFPGDYKEANINQHISIVRLKQDTLINKDFLAYALNSPNQRKYFHSITGGITHPHLNLAQIRETPISIPPLPAQQKISHILSTADKKIEAEENKKIALDELFKSLLHNLMTGKLRVNEL